MSEKGGSNKIGCLLYVVAFLMGAMSVAGFAVWAFLPDNPGSVQALPSADIVRTLSGIAEESKNVVIVTIPAPQSAPQPELEPIDPVYLTAEQKIFLVDCHNAQMNDPASVNWACPDNAGALLGLLGPGR